MNSNPERYRPLPAFESMGGRTPDNVCLIMESGLVSVMRGDHVSPIEDELGTGWVFESEDGRFRVEARPISDDELTEEENIRAHLQKRGEWFSETSKVSMMTNHDIRYWDKQTNEYATTKLVSTLTFEIPIGDGQTCRWTGLTGSFQDLNGQPDPRGEEVVLVDEDEPNKLDAIILEYAAMQVVESWPKPS
jgi:hypothetical protein